jgi:hypothetical protein
MGRSDVTRSIGYDEWPTNISVCGTPVTYGFAVINTGNVKLRGVQLLVPAFAGSSNNNTITCTHTSDGSTWTASELAATSSLSCSGSFSFSQDAIEAGDLSPVVSAAAANLAAAVTMALPAIAVPNTPALSVAVDMSSCVAPSNAGSWLMQQQGVCWSLHVQMRITCIGHQMPVVGACTEQQQQDHSLLCTDRTSVNADLQANTWSAQFWCATPAMSG